MAEKPQAKVAEYKKKAVADFARLMAEYPIIAIVNMENLPAPALQKMRAKLRSTVEMKMTKRRLINLAIATAKGHKKGIEQIAPYLKGMPALLFTKENPFKLAKTIFKSKSPAPAKPGQIAPKDIWIKAGATPFAPGPVISELGAIGLKTGVEAGKVAIKEDKVVTKEGEAIKPNVAAMLTRLGIMPMEIGLDLIAVFENGTIFPKSVLQIDEAQFISSISTAAQEAMNLAVDISYPAKETIELLLAKAFQESKSVALEGNIMADAVVCELLAKAESQMNAVKEQVGELK